MEQRIGSSSQPLEGAGFDPAFVPGLTAPVADSPEKTDKPSDPETDASTDTEAVTETETEAEPEAAVEESAAEDGAAEDGAAEDGAAEDGPVFEAADRRARIVADRRGVRLALDDQECEFRWDEIGAVETERPRFGKRFTVTVHTPDRRWYPIEIEAPARSRFDEWDAQLDEVLDAYFEESEESE
ncbi:hypothetical protein [Streptomyces sp. NPDC054829]